MKTFITFINIKQVSTPVTQSIIQLHNPQIVHPGAHCTALALV